MTSCRKGERQKLIYPLYSTIIGVIVFVLNLPIKISVNQTTEHYNP